MKIENKLVSTEYLQILADWYKDDSVGHKWLSFYGNGSNWMELLKPGSRWGWIVFEDATPIGFIDLEVANDIGYFSYYVAPAFRGQKKSKILLKQLEHLAKEQGIHTLRGEFEAENVHSKKALMSNQYIFSKSNITGMLIASKML